MGWTYAKTEGLTSDNSLHGFDFLLSARESVQGFVQAHAVHGYSRLRLQRHPWPLALDTSPQVFMHTRQ